MKWNEGSQLAWRSQARLRESPGGMAATVSLEFCTKMAENHSQDERFECQFEKMEVLQFFLWLNQTFFLGIVVWDSKLLGHSNWGGLQPWTEVVGKVATLFRNGIFPSEPNKISPNITFPNKDADPHPLIQCWIFKASQHFCLWL